MKLLREEVWSWFEQKQSRNHPDWELQHRDFIGPVVTSAEESKTVTGSTSNSTDENEMSPQTNDKMSDIQNLDESRDRDSRSRIEDSRSYSEVVKTSKRNSSKTNKSAKLTLLI